VPAAAAGTVPTGTVDPSLGGYGSLMGSYPGGSFVAPTAAQALQSPGEQAQMTLGEQAMQQSAAAQGNLLTGGTAEALDQFGQNVASTNYQNTYNNSFNTYSAGYKPVAAAADERVQSAGFARRRGSDHRVDPWDARTECIERRLEQSAEHGKQHRAADQ